MCGDYMKRKERALEPIQFRVDELSLVVGLEKTKIYELINSKELPSYKIGGTRFVHSKDVWSFTIRFRNEQNPDIDIIL
jgi:excisionase family DNA binding protein